MIFLLEMTPRLKRYELETAAEYFTTLKQTFLKWILLRGQNFGLYNFVENYGLNWTHKKTYRIWNLFAKLKQMLEKIAFFF